MKRREEGITLVALVVTIVVLLILAGVSFNGMVNQKGIIKESMETSQNAQRESIIEKIEADLYNEKVIRGRIPTREELKTIIESKGYSKEVNEDSFIAKDGEYKIQYNEIAGWKNI